MSFRPLHNQVVIRRDPKQDKFRGLALVQDEKPPQTGVVVAVGEGHRNKKTGEFIPLDIQVGDRVVFDGYVAEQETHELDGETLCVIPEERVFGVLDELPAA